MLKPSDEPMLINKSDYDRCFAHFNILGCGVRSRDIFYFVAQENYTQSLRWRHLREAPDEDDLERRVVSLMRDEPEGEQWGRSVLGGFAGILGAVTMIPKVQFVVSAISRSVFAIGSGTAGIEADIPAEGAVARLRTIENHVYAAATRRNLWRRDAAGQWTHVSRGIPKSKTIDMSDTFNDLAGFNEQELYAVGGGGDVWRTDGPMWKQCAFPTNKDMETVCCAGDGNVYVSGQIGTTYMGGQDRWTLVHDGNFSIPFKDMVWYEGRVWCTSDYGLWWIQDGKLIEAQVPPSVKGCSGYMAAHDGILLLCGHGGAAFCENGRWEVIFLHGELG